MQLAAGLIRIGEVAHATRLLQPRDQHSHAIKLTDPMADASMLARARAWGGQAMSGDAISSRSRVEDTDSRLAQSVLRGTDSG